MEAWAEWSTLLQTLQKMIESKLGQESGDAWVRDRVKLRSNLSPFHVLTRLCGAKSLIEIQC